MKDTEAWNQGFAAALKAMNAETKAAMADLRFDHTISPEAVAAMRAAHPSSVSALLRTFYPRPPWWRRLLRRFR